MTDSDPYEKADAVRRAGQSFAILALALVLLPIIALAIAIFLDIQLLPH